MKLQQRTFLARVLGDDDLSEFDGWLRARYIQMVRDSFGPKMTESAKDKELAIAYTQAAMLTAFSPQCARMVANVDGVSFMCWLSVRKDHPQETPDTLRKLLFGNVPNINEVNRVVKDLNFPKQSTTTGKTPVKKGARSKRKR